MDDGIEACRVAEDDKFAESELDGSREQEMMAKRSDTLLCEPAKQLPFEFDWDRSEEEDGMITDSERITSAAFMET